MTTKIQEYYRNNNIGNLGSKEFLVFLINFRFKKDPKGLVF